jgi:hypothetical protein
VTDLTASNILYEASAGSTGTVVDGAGGITSLMVGGKLYYGLKDNTYFAESPTTMKTALGNSVPIGYRIVGAKINYSYGTAQSAGTAQYETGYFYITYVRNGTTYYFNTSNSFTTTPVKWKITSDGYIYSGTDYLTSDGKTSTSVSDATRFSISTNNRIYYVNGQTNYYLVYGGMSRFSSYSSTAATWTPETQTATYTAFTPHDYTLTVYDKTGQTAVQTVNITSGTADGTVVLSGLNNDAVKFAISGVSDGQALVTVDLELQSLDPYINSLDVVCHDHNKTAGKTMTQQFTADDFAVAGGSFYFYVPEGFTTVDCNFTFENLKSNYGDNTYYGNTTSTHNSRYYFVNSAYYDANPQQYNTDPNADYTTKILTKKCGNTPFNFSNIDAVNAGTAEELLEYQFSESAYGSQTPAGTLNTDNAIIALDANKKCYLFTCDETRYHIAPTTATEHRAYAYYLMDITLETKNYGASLTWTKLYDNTCYNKEGNDAEDAMYGVKVVATDADGKLVDGYLTAKQINTAINDATKGLGSTDAPTTADQILYVDASDLYSLVVETTSGQTEDDLTTLKNTLAPNCLFYLPTRANYAKPNYAKKTASNSFVACGNIVITDRKPFFAPFDITVPAALSAVYNREITVPANGKVASATIMLPFTISTDADGRHTSNDCTFTLNQLQASNCLSIDQAVDASATNYNANAHFIPISGVAAANTPYMVKVETAPGDATLSFVISQTGSDIKATPVQTDYVFTGETGTGTIQGSSYTFTNNATYAGKKFTDPQSLNIFYFAKDMYLCSKNLRTDFNNLYAYPFRAYFTYTGPNAAKVSGLNVVYGENDNVSTGITDLNEKPDMSITSGYGTITIESSMNKTVNLYGLNGMKIKEANLKAGEARTLSVPAGIYVVNGVKIIVK